MLEEAQEIFNEVTSEANHDDGASNLLETQSEENVSTESETQDGEHKELSLEEQLNSFEVEKPENTEFNPLDAINELGIIHRGLPQEFESMDQVKEYVSKGLDYTVKTQELAEQVKSFQAEKEQYEQQYNSKLDEVEQYQTQMQDELVNNQIMAEIVSELQVNDPDMYNELVGMFQQKQRAYQYQQNNPMVQNLTEKIKNLENQLTQKGQIDASKENETISAQWQDGISSVQKDWGLKLRTLGIKPDWNSIKDVWAKDPSNSLTVQQAFFTVHGDQITKALESSKKAVQAKNKAALRTGPEKINNDVQPTTQTLSRRESYLDVARDAARELGVNI